jgi:hypothetical protein
MSPRREKLNDYRAKKHTPGQHKQFIAHGLDTEQYTAYIYQDKGLGTNPAAKCNSPSQKVRENTSGPGYQGAKSKKGRVKTSSAWSEAVCVQRGSLNRC